MSVAGKTFADERDAEHRDHVSTSHDEEGGSGSSGTGDSGEDTNEGGSDEGGLASNSTSNSGQQSSSNSSQSITQNQVRDVVQSGKAVSLPLVLAYMDNYYKGQVLDIKLRSSLFGYYYDVKYLDASNHLLTVALDAKTLTKR